MLGAAQAHDAVGTVEQGFGRYAACGHDHFRRNQFHHPVHEGTAYGQLLRLRIAVSGRAPVIHIGDESVFLAVAVDRGQHLVEQLPGLADKGQALAVLVGAGAFADHHQAGAGRAVIDDCIF